MKSISIVFLCSILATTIPCHARPKKEKQPKQHQKLETEENESDGADRLSSDHHYHPNPVILAGVGQIMNGALNIAQDPHSRPNVGHSVANMIHGIMTIVIEKVAKKNIGSNDPHAIEECLRELSIDLGQEITEIIVTKQISL